MSYRRLPNETISYIREMLSGNVGLASFLFDKPLKDPFTFSPAGVPISKLINPGEGGVLTQSRSDADIVRFIESSTMPEVTGILIQDPWSKNSDLDNFDDIPPGIIRSDANLYYFFERKEFSQFALSSFRMNVVSYLKIIYGMRLGKVEMCELLGSSQGRFDDRFCAFTKFVLISAYDDEGWLGALFKD